MNHTGKGILDRVRRGIAANRHPGLHFPGYFLGLHASELGAQGVRTAIPYGPHCANANGDMNLCAIALLADMGMGAAMRMHLPGATRMATATMQLQFTGLAVRGDLDCEAHFDGFFQGAAARQGRIGGVLKSGGDIVCHGSATFATPPAPPGVTVHAVPWEYLERAHEAEPLPLRDMGEDEQRVMQAARAALKGADERHAFIEHLWAQVARPRDSGGADNAAKIGPHMGNRVGHVQGGVIFGIAAATGIAALPSEARLTGAYAWYISAGMGKKLRARATVLQQGRTIAVVRTEVRDDNKRLVMEMMTSHAF